MTIRFLGPLLGGGLLMLAVLMPATAPAAGTIGVCSPTKVKYLASTSSIVRASAIFGNIPEAGFGFVQGGASASCVIVRFSGLVQANAADDQLIIRAFLDNTTAALPSEVIYSFAGAAEARSFEFIFPSVAPGNHFVRMQYKSFGGGQVTMYQRNTVVQHAP